MERMKKFNENFVKKGLEKVGKWISPDPTPVGDLNDTEKKYTEKELFDIAEDAFKYGMCNGDYQRYRNLSNPLYMNVYREWWNDLFYKSRGRK